MTNPTRKRAVRLASILLPCAAVAALGLYLSSSSDETRAQGAKTYERPPLTRRISFGTAADADRRRRDLRRFVFGTDELPDALPVVHPAITDAEFTRDLPNLARVDRMTINMPLGFRSVAYHAVPRRANGALLVYHGGHRQGLAAGKRTIAYFLDRGYALLVFAMPFEGLNTHPETLATPCGRVSVTEGQIATYHDAMECLPSAFRYFVAPVAVGLNHTRRFGYRLTAMTGLSGGGWTTMLYAALDPRVHVSYPVAGSRPHYVSWRLCPRPRTVPRCFGDFEQRAPGLYRIANHLELYILGSWGEGRSQLAIYNLYDRCCFAGTAYREWTPRVQAALRRLGSGFYRVVADSTHRDHLISRFTRGVIEADLERQLRGIRTR